MASNQAFYCTSRKMGINEWKTQGVIFEKVSMTHDQKFEEFIRVSM